MTHLKFILTKVDTLKNVGLTYYQDLTAKYRSNETKLASFFAS